MEGNNMKKTILALATEAQIIYDELKADGYNSQVTKKEYAEIVRCSVSAVDKYIAGGYGIPDYKKIGHQKNARVLFALRDVATYLVSQNVKTA